MSILVLDPHLVGDIVMLLPLLDALRRQFPQAHLALVAGPWCRPILQGTHAVDELFEFSAPWVKPQPCLRAVVSVFRLVATLRRRRWDLGIDVRGDIRHILLLLLAKCRRRVGFDLTGGAALLTTVVPDSGRLASILDHHERLATSIGAFDGQTFVPRMCLTEQEEQLAQHTPPFIGFHFGASLPLRRLPIVEAVSLVETQADRTDLPLVVFGASDIADYVAELLQALPPVLRVRVQVWNGSLREFIVTASRARVMYTMDSGPAHITAALGPETIVFFGPNRSAYTAPRGANVHVVERQSPLPCQPCDQRRCIHPDTYQACLRGLVPRAITRGPTAAERAERILAPTPA